MSLSALPSPTHYGVGISLHDVVSRNTTRKHWAHLRDADVHVISSYLTAQNRVHQYTQLLKLLRREEDEWAEKVLKGCRADYITQNLRPDVTILKSGDGYLGNN
ncbi:hypothetical protein EDB19DRAFT_1835526 [Suillus lakei]|nr:hypothetical protein EDB19DRAFT_1835526 [Suillus lakei]